MLISGYDRRTNRRIIYNPRPGSGLLFALFACIIGLLFRGVIGWILVALAAITALTAMSDILAWFRVYGKSRCD